jgi:phosphoribosyl-dephospho-CoA transferase
MQLDVTEVTPHTLLRIAGVESLAADVQELPAWAPESLRRAPWVVVRRTPVCGSNIPVGLRGETRSQRIASWLPESAVLECVTIRQLSTTATWKHAPRRTQVPALEALERVAAIMRAHGFEYQWGPTGSVGFELASGCSTATERSDLDLALRLDRPLSVASACSLHSALAALPVRTDLLLEMPHGAVALCDYATSRGSFVLRTMRGPRLVRDLWSDGETIAAA